METDRHYFFKGLFIIGLSIAAAICAVWLGKSGNRDDVLYRIHFSESVSGLSVGDLVKYHGVGVGSVATLALDPADPRRVQVDVSLRKEAPVRADTRAMLTMKGITVVVCIELTGGKPDAAALAEPAAEGEPPEIPSERSNLDALLEKLPRLIDRFSSIGDQTKNVLADVHEVTAKGKDNPSLLIWAPKAQAQEKPPVGSDLAGVAGAVGHVHA